MTHVMLSINQNNFGLTIESDGNIKLDSIPDHVTTEAINSLKVTLNATNAILHNPDFWADKNVAISNQNAIILANSVKKTVNENKSIFHQLKDKSGSHLEAAAHFEQSLNQISPKIDDKP